MIDSDAYDAPDWYDASTSYDGGSLFPLSDNPASGIPSKHHFFLKERLPDTDWHKIETDRRAKFDEAIKYSIGINDVSPKAEEPAAVASENTEIKNEIIIKDKQDYALELLLLSQYN